MNFITVSAKAVDKPQVLKSRIPCVVCNVEIPAPNYIDRKTGDQAANKGLIIPLTPRALKLKLKM